MIKGKVVSTRDMTMGELWSLQGTIERGYREGKIDEKQYNEVKEDIRQCMLKKKPR